MTDHRIPAAEDCVARQLVDRHAAERPDAIFASWATDEPDWTYADLREKVVATARALHEHGVRQGDHVVVWLENGTLLVRTWLAINYLGAVYVPLNPSYKGGLLQHAIELSDAKLAIAHAELVPRLAGIGHGRLERVLVAGPGTAEPVAGLELADAADLVAPAAGEPPAPERPVEPWDPQSIMLTSGTTGPSKAVLSCYAHLHALSIHSFPGTTAEDRALIHTPLFHVTGMVNIAWALRTGGGVAVFERFTTTTFFRDVRATGATFGVMIGALASFLLRQPRTEDEERTPLRLLLLTPLTDETRRFAERIGVRYYGVFNMTETSVPLRTAMDPQENGSCGTPRDGVEVRIVDEHDGELPRGEVGELIIRADAPWAMNSGYYNNPEATARAWRNGWFHTGDACRQDEAGNFYYVDRVKDAIRRRGENISSYEVEAEVVAHPGVEECAAIGVPSPHGEQDVLVAVKAREGATIDPAELLGFLVDRMPHYMVPRYVRMVEALPKTPTQKVRKALLREQAVTADTWDREAAGIRVRRDRLTRS